MSWALDQCLILLHPIMPFLTEALWGELAPRENLLVHAPWPALDPTELADGEADAEIRWVIRLIENIRSVRSELNVPPGARISMTLTGATETAKERAKKNAALIATLSHLSGIEYGEAAEGSVTIALEDCAANLQLAEVIDIATERARLEKSLGKTRKDAAGIERKLGNDNFLAKAPEQVIEEQRDRLAAARSEAAKLEGALDRLAALR